MKLYTYCKSCKSNIKIKSDAPTRPELQMVMGDELKINCKNCGKMDKAHVNDIKAEPNRFILILGVILGVLFSILLWTYYNGIATISIIIPLLFWQQQRTAVRAFNSYMIKRKIA